MTNYADPELRYLVEVRCPEAGERYIHGGQIVTAAGGLRLTRFPVIVGEHRLDSKQVPS